MADTWEQQFRELNQYLDITVEFSLNLSRKGLDFGPNLERFKQLESPYEAWLKESFQSDLGHPLPSTGSSSIHFHRQFEEDEYEYEAGEKVAIDDIWSARKVTRYVVLGMPVNPNWDIPVSLLLFRAAGQIRGLANAWASSQDVEGLYVHLDYSPMALRHMCTGYVKEVAKGHPKGISELVGVSLMLTDTFALGPTRAQQYLITVRSDVGTYRFEVQSNAHISTLTLEAAHLESPLRAWPALDHS